MEEQTIFEGLHEATREELESADGTYITESRATEIVGEDGMQEMKDAFIEDRYPSDYRDDAPLPEDFEESLEITAYLVNDVTRKVYVRITDAEGKGDGTGLYYRAI